jgi:hypothetical protein
VEQIIRIGMDTSKHIFQLHGVNAAEQPVLRRKLRRKDMVAFFEQLEPTVIAIEACGGSHHWARLLRSSCHEVKLIAPQLAKPYVKRGKNDAADAEALTWAFSRQGFRFNNSSIVSGRLFRYPGLSPFCDLVVSAPVQTHIRSALEAAAPLSRLRRAGAQEDETILCGGY